MGEPEVQIVLAVITLAGVVITSVVGSISAFYTSRMRKDVDSVNDAVNHRHLKTGSSDAPKLYDLAWENHVKVSELIEWKRTYDGGPFDSGTKVEEYVKQNNEAIKEIKEDVRKIKENCPEGGRLPCHYLVAKSKDETKDKGATGFGHSMEG